MDGAGLSEGWILGDLDSLPALIKAMTKREEKLAECRKRVRLKREEALDPDHSPCADAGRTPFTVSVKHLIDGIGAENHPPGERSCEVNFKDCRLRWPSGVEFVPI